MKKIYLMLTSVIVLTAVTFSATAQQSFFAPANEAAIKGKVAGKRTITPGKFALKQLSVNELKSFLWGLPAEQSVNRQSAPVLEMPMPDGSMARFHVWESSIQEPGLQAKFPEIRTFAGQGIDDPYAMVRFDFTGFGFHAQIISAAKGDVYIDPYSRGDVNYYMSYFTKDNNRSTGFHCETVTDMPVGLDGRTLVVPVGPCRGTQLFTYRLAVACTGEYAVAVGGTTAALLHSAIVTSVNRVDGVYEKEVAVRLILIANNNVVEYLNAATDPFTGNNAAGTLINESQTVIDANIGSANYDIGHTFSTGGGGLAQLGCVCGSSKARGITGSPAPFGDDYDIDYVSHEMGHQFGGAHTFNSVVSSCGGGNRNTATAYEVGSGTTIQAYAGICGSDDIQPHSDPYFHTVSFDQISNFLQAGGNSCKGVILTNNNIPVITAMSNNGVSIPIGTPFTLSATATDADGDPLTYSWEDWNQTATGGAWNSGATSTTAPLFKARIPKTTGSRTFPDIAIINANYPAAPAAVMNGLKGETLPQVARVLQFRLQVRDNRTGGGGVVTGGSGCGTFSTPFTVNVVGTAPFVVTVPNGGESYPAGSTQTITWNVAGTDIAPVSASNVKITMSTDGGLTYPTVISNSTPNDGSEALVIPGPATTTAKIKVEGIGNIFFDVSNANFTISVPVNGFSFNPSTPTTAPCPAGTPTVTIGTTVSGTFTTPINLTASGVPAGTTVTFVPNPLTPGASTVASLNNASTLAPGTYNITVTGTAGAVIQTTTITYIISATATITNQPTAQTTCVGSTATFSVTATGTGLTYQWQSGPSATGTFTNVATGGTAATYTTPTATLAMNGTYYRVIVTSPCGSVTSNAVLLTVIQPITVTQNPVALRGCALDNYTFSVTATGTGLAYQWQVSTNGGTTYTNITGATAATYTITGAALALNGNLYRVVITATPCGTVTTSGVSLTLAPKPTVVLTPANGTTLNPSIVSGLYTTVSPIGNYLYDWRKNGVQIPNTLGATSIPLTVDNYGTYQVSVIEVASGCTSTSNVVVIDSSVSSRLFIYPNPVTTNMQVRYYSANPAARGTMLNVYDAKGARVVAMTFANVSGTYGRMDVDMSKMVQGVYMVEVRDASGKRLASASVLKSAN